ncbi:unnamed protein product [Linum trigynum]|uniref:Uncharacterized protein n=1 Tax=Linum trigynum TaxID=586398 RepID=A0AAV2FKX7_9ROSI
MVCQCLVDESGKQSFNFPQVAVPESDKEETSGTVMRQRSRERAKFPCGKRGFRIKKVIAFRRLTFRRTTQEDDEERRNLYRGDGEELNERQREKMVGTCLRGLGIVEAMDNGEKLLDVET